MEPDRRRTGILSERLEHIEAVIAPFRTAAGAGAEGWPTSLSTSDWRALRELPPLLGEQPQDLSLNRIVRILDQTAEDSYLTNFEPEARYHRHHSAMMEILGILGFFGGDLRERVSEAVYREKTAERGLAEAGLRNRLRSEADRLAARYGTTTPELIKGVQEILRGTSPLEMPEASTSGSARQEEVQGTGPGEADQQLRYSASPAPAEVLRAALEDALVWHEAQEKALSKQPPNGANSWQRNEHQEQMSQIRKALGREE